MAAEDQSLEFGGAERRRLEQVGAGLRAFAGAVGCLVLGFSPLGFVVPYLIFAWQDLCNGALGSGVHCGLPGYDVYEAYFENMAVIFEVTCFLAGLCLLWGLAAVIVWLGVFVLVGKGLYHVVQSRRTVPST